MKMQCDRYWQGRLKFFLTLCQAALSLHYIGYYMILIPIKHTPLAAAERPSVAS